MSIGGCGDGSIGARKPYLYARDVFNFFQPFGIDPTYDSHSGLWFTVFQYTKVYNASAHRHCAGTVLVFNDRKKMHQQPLAAAAINKVLVAVLLRKFDPIDRETCP